MLRENIPVQRVLFFKPGDSHVRIKGKTNETYIVYGVVDHNSSIRFTDGMPQDLTKLIEKIKASAVDRCRDRIDAAASKARGLISTNTAETCKNTPPGTVTRDVTSVFKKRHGL